MDEENNLDDTRELKDEELEAASGGVIFFKPFKCGFCGATGHLSIVGKKGNDDIYLCDNCGVESVNGERIN